MDVSNRFQAWSLETVFVSSDERHHLHPDAEPDVWRRGALLGSGGFGDVFTERCVDGPRRHQTRAVKQIRKSPETLRLFQRELVVLVDFATDNNEHDSRDNFVRFLGWFGDNTHLYIAMELVPFGDLQSHISKRPCSERDTSVIVGQVGRALQYMHERNFVHRDLKPANILVAKPRPDWHVKLTDFGVSKNVDNTELRTQVGTEAYMAPELFDRNNTNTKVTSAVDVWSLGAVAFCARTGKAPFSNTYELCKFSSGTTRIPTQPLMRSSGAFVDFISSLMEKSPTGRPTMAEALEHCWVVSEGGNIGSNRSDTLVSTRSDDEWEAQASAMWNTGVPSASRPSIRLHQTASQDTTRPGFMSSRSLHIREGPPPDRDRNIVPQRVAAPASGPRSPPPRQLRPLNAERNARQAAEDSGSTFTQWRLPFHIPIRPYPGDEQRNAGTAFAYPRLPSPTNPATTSARPLSPTTENWRWDTWNSFEYNRSPSTSDSSMASIRPSPPAKRLPDTLPFRNPLFEARSKIIPQWDNPGWLRGGHEVMAKVPHLDGSLRDLSSVMATADLGLNAQMILKLDLHYLPVSPGWNGVSETGYARLHPSTTKYIFQDSVREYREIVDDLECQALARAFALEFNAFAFPSPIIDFLIIPFITMPFMTGNNKDWYLLKEYTHDLSAIRLYNDNRGFADITPDEWNMTAQAFSHFTFERSKGQFLICGLMGYNGLFSNPEVHSVAAERNGYFSNCGIKGFRDFFNSHRCNSICHRLRLKSSKKDLLNSSLRFQEHWLAHISVTSCRNLLCGRTVVVTRVVEPGHLPRPLWCQQCKVQVKSSEAMRICPFPGPQHTFKTNDFFHKVQGLTIPTLCRKHREPEAVQAVRDDSKPLE